MTSTKADPTLDRLLRHMACANAQQVARLLEQPVDALALTAPRHEWPAGRILAHLLNAALGYASQIEGGPRPSPFEPPGSAAQLAAAPARLADVGGRVGRQATGPDVPVSHRDPARGHGLRSTILGQAIH